MGFSQILHLLLKDNAISNYTLSKNIGVSQSTIANWLNGVSTPNFTKLLKIADYFHVSVDYLLGRTDKAAEINSNNTVTGNNNIIGNGNTVGENLSEQEKALFNIFKNLDVVKQAQLLAYAAELKERVG